MVRENDTLVPLAHHAAGPITIYLDVADPSLPESHPRRHLGRSSLAAIAHDMFPPAHALRVLYEWDPLLRFLAAALGREQRPLVVSEAVLVEACFRRRVPNRLAPSERDAHCARRARVRRCSRKRKTRSGPLEQDALLERAR